MANKIKEVYKLLGIEIGDKVLINGTCTTFDATERGLRDFALRIDNFMLTELIRGNKMYGVVKGEETEAPSIKPIDAIKEGMKEVLARKDERSYRFTANINDRSLFDELIKEKEPTLQIKDETLFCNGVNIGRVDESLKVKCELMEFETMYVLLKLNPELKLDECYADT